jgi:hypothetical protein
VPQQRGLFLRACERNAELACFVPVRQRRRDDSSQVPRDFVLGHRRAFDAVMARRRAVATQDLNRTHALATDRLEQVEGPERIGPEPAGDPPADRVAVRQEVVEIVLDRGPLQR